MTIPNYGEKGYWEKRYESDPKQTFEWYMDWKTIKKVLESCKVEKNVKILQVGCGSSTLAEEMYDAGYTDITNVDFVQQVIELMQQRSAEKRPDLKYLVMDVTDNSLRHMSETFKVVIDKGTLDSIVCGSNVKERGSAMLANIHSCLDADGIFFLFSYGPPEDRLNYLQDKQYDMDVMIKTVEKPSLKVALEGGTSNIEPEDYVEGKHYENCLFVYICKKRMSKD